MLHERIGEYRSGILHNEKLPRPSVTNISSTTPYDATEGDKSPRVESHEPLLT